MLYVVQMCCLTGVQFVSAACHMDELVQALLYAHGVR
jgi:hypothetical protein